MFHIRLDLEKNRIYVNLVGVFTPEEMKKCVDETIMAIQKLKRGYTVVTDITRFKPGLPEVTKEIARIQKYFVNSGARRGVRIIGESASSGTQFNRTGNQTGYESVNVATAEEAEKILSE